MKFYLALIKLLLVSALLIISNNNLALADPHNRALFWDQYYAWLSRAFDQGVEITGYVVRSDWLPEAGSNSPAPDSLRSLQR